MKKLFLFLTCFLALFCRAQHPFRFTSDGGKQQSAGVFDEKGRLVRTLFTNKIFPAGSNPFEWDGKDDWGNVLPEGKYSVRLLSSNIKAEWEGTIANSSKQNGNTTWGGSKRHFGYYGAAIDIYEHNNGWVYYTTGYSEGNITVRKFHVDDPETAVYLKKNSSTQYAEEQGGKLQGMASTFNLASDGAFLYCTGMTFHSQKVSNGVYTYNNAIFVYAFDLSNDQMKTWSSGQSLTLTNYYYPSVVVLDSELGESPESNLPTGIAVDGTHMYVAQGNQNKIRTFNKSTGASVTSTTGIRNPRRMASDGKDLWIIYGTNSVGKFSVNNGSIAASPAITLAGLEEPHSLSVATVNGVQYIYVTDAGKNQVVRRYRTSDGSIDNSFNRGVGYFGQLGGYTKSAVVSDDRFYFATNDRKLAGIHVKNDGTTWICDDGNNRMLRYNASLEATHRVQWEGATYYLRMVENDNTRLLSNYSEFKVDYNSPIQQGWKLTRQYKPTIPDYIESPNEVVKLPNGRTYMMARTQKGYVPLNPSDGRNPANFLVVWELTDAGARRTNVEKWVGSTWAHGWTIWPDGSLVYRSNEDGKSSYLERYALLGFDGNHNPIWSTTGKIVGKTPPVDKHGVSNFPIGSGPTADGQLIWFDPARPDDANMIYRRGYHIGAIKYDTVNGANVQNWIWRGAKATTTSYNGDYPIDGSFDIGNGVAYPGGEARHAGDFIVWNHHGEFWKGGQTNMNHLMYKNGLQLMQFGTAVANAQNVLPKGYPGMAGNALTIALTKVGDALYLWHGDEGYHSGIHRWKITGLNTVEETVIPLGVETREMNAAFSADQTAGCATLDVKFSDLSDPGTESISSWLWDFGDGTTSSSQHPTHTYQKTGDYTVTLKVTTVGGTTKTVSRNQYIRVSAAPKPAIVSTAAACAQETINFKGEVADGNSTGLSWRWNFGNGKTDTAVSSMQVYTTPGTYTVSADVSNGQGCTTRVEKLLVVNAAPAVSAGSNVEICEGSTTKLKATGADTYTWTNATSLSCTTCAEPVASPKDSTVYTVTGKSANGCSATASVSVKVRKPFNLSVGKAQEVCAGTTVKLEATGADHYTWSPSAGVANSSAGTTTATPLVSTLYQVVARDKNNCFTDTASIYVKVSPSPSVNAGADAEICHGSFQQLKATGAVKYSWQSTSSLSCTDCDSPLAAPSQTTTYVVTGYNSIGCSSKDTVTVSVRQPFALSISAPQDICAGETVRLEASGADTYLWLPAKMVTNPTAAVTTAQPSTTTSYSVIGRDKYNCFSDTATVQVNVWPTPSVEAGTALTLSVGKTVKLNPSYSSDVAKYKWSPATGLDCATCPTPTASPKTATTYSVEVSNAGGCTAKDEVTVHVICNNGNLSFPNTFSPNGDGKNDVFFPKGGGISTIKSLRIYNRWGELVFSRENFSANSPASGWDGTYKGAVLSSDTYIYTCEVVCMNKEVLMYKGDVTLLR